MTDINLLLTELNFKAAYHVENRASIADLFKPDKRCGIYILHFATGECYIGQAVDVARRYVQHCKNHTDILKISFQPIKQQSLNHVEQTVIQRFERENFQLRNIALTSIPKGESDFDQIMPEEVQNEWLNNLSLVDLDGNRPTDPALRQKYQRRFHQFEQKKASREVLTILQAYVLTGIPAIKRGEISFWSCSCLPSYQTPGVTIFSRVNVYWQEVFTISEYRDDLSFSWHVARTPLEAHFGLSLSGLRQRFPFVTITGHQYTPGGADQVNLAVGNAPEALKLLKDQSVLQATRLFNLRLMKKGACTYSRYHCLPLADKLINEPHFFPSS